MIALLAMILAVILFVNGHNAYATAIIIVEFVALAAVFVTGRLGQERERERIDPREATTIDVDGE